ncbi:ADP-ribosylglycohydrolase family protein [uncultured Thermanaerothrix sp.]|uniref:ADP-ribosylglycohydrolase family protein n=1 Tax=uncultured Thermanaerothrix sp. TaxID=1195149 RepID=UPI0026353D1F|nr:ADP-ribosylglycohydrolase family protein [uncultured Thermanaerothrix sp.]
MGEEGRERSRWRGVAVGAAVGDALGMPLEFGLASHPRALIRSMRPGRLPAGHFTDDTELALAVAATLLERGYLDPDDLAQRFAEWYCSEPPDVGVHTQAVLSRLAAGESWEEAAEAVFRERPESAGNGALMRSWPVALAFWRDLEALRQASVLQCRVTHRHAECVAACVFLNTLLARLVAGANLEAALETAFVQASPLPAGLAHAIRLAPRRRREELRNTGWVRHTLETAVWSLFNSHTFEEALIQAVNLGADADTAGAVTGALAGALYGVEAIPEEWRTALHGEYPLKSGHNWGWQDLVNLADRLAMLQAQP